MYEIRIYKKAEKEIVKISKLHQQALLETFYDLKENPFTGKALSRELTGKFSYKIGPYRIVYKINQKDKIVQIITVGHRSRVYLTM